MNGRVRQSFGCPRYASLFSVDHPWTELLLNESLLAGPLERFGPLLVPDPIAYKVVVTWRIRPNFSLSGPRKGAYRIDDQAKTTYRHR